LIIFKVIYLTKIQDRDIIPYLNKI